MNGTTKKWYMSQTIISALVTIIALIAGFVGYEISIEEQASLVELLVQLITTVVGLIAAISAIRGRKKATQQIE